MKTKKIIIFSFFKHLEFQWGAGLRWRDAAPLQDNGRGNTEVTLTTGVQFKCVTLNDDSHPSLQKKDRTSSFSLMELFWVLCGFVNHWLYSV